MIVSVPIGVAVYVIRLRRRVAENAALLIAALGQDPEQGMEMVERAAGRLVDISDQEYEDGEGEEEDEEEYHPAAAMASMATAEPEVSYVGFIFRY